MRITGEGIWGPPVGRAKRLLRRVLELGVNLIDTADSYVPEVSENLIAEALHPYPRRARRGDEGRADAPRARRLAARRPPRALEGVLRCQPAPAEARANRPLPAACARPGGAAGGVARRPARAPGRKVRHIGVSNVSADELEQAREVVDVATVQNRYNAADRNSEDVLDACERAGIGFIPGFRSPPAGSPTRAGRWLESRPGRTRRPVRSRSHGCWRARR